MSLTVSLEEAQGRLKELISQRGPGDELIITENDRPIAVLSAKPAAERTRRVPGLGKGMIVPDCIRRRQSEYTRDIFLLSIPLSTPFE